MLTYSRFCIRQGLRLVQPIISTACCASCAVESSIHRLRIDPHENHHTCEVLAALLRHCLTSLFEWRRQKIKDHFDFTRDSPVLCKSTLVRSPMYIYTSPIPSSWIEGDITIPVGHRLPRAQYICRGLTSFWRFFFISSSCFESSLQNNDRIYLLYMYTYEW